MTGDSCLPSNPIQALDSFARFGRFTLQLLAISIFSLLLDSILEVNAVVLLRHPVGRAMVFLTVRAQASDELSGFLASIEGAARFLDRHLCSVGQLLRFRLGLRPESNETLRPLALCVEQV